MVVVAGRPNVGKSSLVNRIVGTRAAVVEEEQGVTRDRKVLTAEWAGVPFSIMDTGGWLAAGSDLEEKVSRQAERALAEADVILMVVDVAIGRDRGGPGRGQGHPPGRPSGAPGGQQGGRRQPGGGRVGVRLARPGRPLSGERAARAGDRRPARRGGLPAARSGGGRRAGCDGRRLGVGHACRPRRRDTAPAAGRAAPRRIPPRPGWPSSADPTSASRPSSTGCSARSARSCTTCRGRHATPSTRWWTPRRDRSASSTRPGCAAPPRPTAAPSSTPRCGRCGRWSGPTSPSWSSTPPWAPPTRTSAWPSASACRGARPSWC